MIPGAPPDGDDRLFHAERRALRALALHAVERAHPHLLDDGRAELRPCQLLYARRLFRLCDRGADRLLGGDQADTFVFRARNDSTVDSAGRDKIGDFSRSEGDKLGLSGIDAKTAAKGNNAFSFIGDDAFDKHAGELRYAHKNGNTLVQGDVNGDGKADFAFVLEGTIGLKASDFIL